MSPSGRLFHGFLEAAPDAVVIIDGRGLQLHGLRKDGHEFPIDVSLSPLPPEAGILIASTIRDMTAQRCLEGELRKRTFELEEADRQKDQFLAVVALEFRSPLAVLTNLARILCSPQANAAARQRAVDALGRQTTHMIRLVEDLLDVSRVRRGEVSLRSVSVDLSTVFSKAVEMDLALVESRKHHLEVVQFAEPLWVSCDSTRLVQIVSNLLTNAAKYARKGEISGSRHPGRTVRLRSAFGTTAWVSPRRCCLVSLTCLLKLSRGPVAEPEGLGLD